MIVAAVVLAVVGLLLERVMFRPFLADFDRIVARVAAESRPVAEENEESTETVSKTGDFSLADIEL